MRFLLCLVVLSLPLWAMKGPSKKRLKKVVVEEEKPYSCRYNCGASFDTPEDRHCHTHVMHECPQLVTRKGCSICAYYLIERKKKSK